MSTESTSLTKQVYDIAGSYGINPAYTMTITAWKMESLFQDLHLFDSDENSPDLLVDGIGEIVLSEIKDLASTTVNVVSDMANYVADNDLGGVVGAMVDGASETISGVIDKLTSYTDGAEPIRSAPVCHFVMPVPQNLTDTLRHQYDQDTFTPLETVKHIGKWITKKVISSEATNRILDSAVEFNIKQAKRNNFAFDNNLINIYKQTEQREFIFNITLIPQSYEHYKEILSSYARLKILMTGAKVGGNMAMIQTHSFTIKFDNLYFEKYMMLNDAVDVNLETLEIDVSGNPYVTYDDYVPKAMQMIMTFRERRPLRNEVSINSVING